MASRLTIRPGRSRDIPQLRKIEKAARARYASAHRFSFAAETPPIATNRLAEGDVIVAEADGQLAGFILMNPMDGMLYIANISVDPAISGQGFGAALIEAAQERAIAQGLSALTLTTFRVPRWNAPWFRRIGFQPMPPDQVLHPALPHRGGRLPVTAPVRSRQALAMFPNLDLNAWKTKICLTEG